MDKVVSCKICGNNLHNHYFVAKERMLGINDEFDYFECADCGCIQIEEIPVNMNPYYSNDYYSYKVPFFKTKLTGLRFILKNNLAKYFSGNFTLIGFMMSIFYEDPFPWLKPNIVNFNSKILDIGCGSGRLLLSMRRSGYKNLTGIDPYIKEDIFYSNGVTVYQKNIFEMEDRYDLVMLHHSFEHMESPKDILMKAREIINDNGYIIIRIPVAKSYAWRKYQTYWVQLDAPRHFYLHTVKSIHLLAKECDLTLRNVKYESTIFQFVESEKYLRGIAFNDKDNIFTKSQIRFFEKEAKRLNKLNDGDSACFYMQKAKK